MNSSLALDMETTLGEQLAFLAFPAKRSAEQVPTTIEQLVSTIATLVDQIITDVAYSRSRVEFRSKVETLFPQYGKIMIALAKLITASVEPRVIDRLVYESLSELEADFRDEGQIFGEVIKDQAIFTAWTLRKINELVEQCCAKPASPENAGADEEFGRKYLSNILYVRFCLDSLRMSLRTGRPLFPEPLEDISDGLRAIVDAYAWVRQARDLRHPVVEEEPIEIEWDEEQQELLQSSMQEVLREEF